MHRVQDLAKKTANTIAAHFKENEQLINEANNLQSEFKENSKILKKCVSVKQRVVEKCTSLHHLEFEPATPKMTPFERHR